jgi:hypothetical protein
MTPLADIIAFVKVTRIKLNMGFFLICVIPHAPSVTRKYVA